MASGMSQDLRHFVDILDTLDAIVWEADAETWAFTYVNDAAGRILGYPPERWVGHEGLWQSLIHPDDRERTIAFCRDACRAGRDHEFDYRAVAADGRIVWLHDVVRVVTDHTGTAQLLRGVMTDISDRKHAEEQRMLDIADLRLTQQQLAESEERYRLLSELTSDYAWSLRVDESGGTRVDWLTGGFERVTGYDAEAFQQGSWEDLIHRDDVDAVGAAFAPLYEGRGMDVETRIVRADGEIRWLHALAKPVLDTSGGLVRIVGSARDITERKLAEEERERLQAQLIQSQKMEAIGRLAGGVAHDFNNILAAILNYATFIQQNPDAPKSIAEDAAEIVKAGERAAALTRQLLVFSRRETPRLEHLDLTEVVVEYARFLERTLGEDVELRLGLAPHVKPVLADRLHIEQVLLNLAVNARDAMPQGGVLTISTQQVAPDRVRLSVDDSGSGMSSEIAERAFEPFFTTKAAGQGTGLGLSTVYGIAKSLGGTAKLESGKDGTTVRIELPISDRAEGQDPQRSDREPPRSRPLTILVVEDEDQLRTLIARMLKLDEHVVVPAASAQEALQLEETVVRSIDLLLTDVVLPGMSGIELARTLRGQKPQLPILYMSGYPADVIAAQGGIDAPLLEKPFTQAELREAIAEEIRKASKPDA